VLSLGVRCFCGVISLHLVVVLFCSGYDWVGFCLLGVGFLPGLVAVALVLKRVLRVVSFLFLLLVWRWVGWVECLI